MNCSSRLVRPSLSWFGILLLSILSLLPSCNADAAAAHCEKEEHLELDGCTLTDLPDSALKSICDRIGLDVETHVFPYLFENEQYGEGGDSSTNAGGEVEVTKREHTHLDYVKAAEECFLIEQEMDRLSLEDPDLMEALEREALEDDPELLAEVIADVLAQDPSLMDELIDKMSKDAPEVLIEMMSVLDAEGEYESIEDMGSSISNEGGEMQQLKKRPDLVGYFVATMLSENPDLLDELDAHFADHEFAIEEEDFFDSEAGYADIGGGEEL